MQGIEDFLKGNRTWPPPLNPHLCRFGQWLDGDGRRHGGPWQAFQTIEALHRQMHATAAHVLDRHAAGVNADAVQGLDKLYTARDGLIEQLGCFLQRPFEPERPPRAEPGPERCPKYAHSP